MHPSGSFTDMLLHAPPPALVEGAAPPSPDLNIFHHHHEVYINLSHYVSLMSSFRIAILLSTITNILLLYLIFLSFQQASVEVRRQRRNSDQALHPEGDDQGHHPQEEVNQHEGFQRRSLMERLEDISLQAHFQQMFPF